jgi:serine/threonine protein kinase
MLIRHAGQTILVLKDPGGEPLDRILEREQGRALDLTRFLSISIGFVRALAQVHRHDLIYKDIKPSNVLVDQNGHMWLSGFGDCFLNCLTSAKRPHRRKSSPAPTHIWRQNKPVA